MDVWIIYAFATALILSVMILAQKKALLREHTMEFTVILGIFNLLVSIPLFFIVDYSTLPWGPVGVLFLYSSLGAGGFYFIAKSIKHAEVSVVTPLMTVGPAVTAILAFMVLGETLSLLQASGIGFLIMGSYVLESRKHQKILDPLKRLRGSKFVHYLIFALVLYSISSIFDRVILSSYNLPVEAYVPFIHLFMAFHFIGIYLVFGKRKLKEVKITLKRTGWIILVIAVLTVSYRFTQAKAVSLAYVGLVLSIKRLSALFVVLVGGELFHEKHLLKKFVASLIMVAGAILIVI